MAKKYSFVESVQFVAKNSTFASFAVYVLCSMFYALKLSLDKLKSACYASAQNFWFVEFLTMFSQQLVLNLKKRSAKKPGSESGLLRRV